MKKAAAKKAVPKKVANAKASAALKADAKATSTKKAATSPLQPKIEGNPLHEWGKLKEVSGFVFLEKEVTITEGTGGLGYRQLPRGYSLPSVQDYTNLIASLGSNAYEVLLDPKGFAGKEGMNYMTNEKSFPDLHEGGDDRSWRFKALVLKNKKASVEDVSSFFGKGAMLGKVAPIKDGYDFNFPVSCSITAPIKVSVPDPTGVVSAEWAFGDGGKAAGLSASYQYKSNYQLFWKNHFTRKKEDHSP